MGLDPELCATAARQEVEYIRRHKIRVACQRETAKAPIKTGWAETDKGQLDTPILREVGCEGIQDACEARVVRVDAAAGGAESRAVGGRHGKTWRKGCGIGRRAKGVLLRSSTKKSIRRTAAKRLPAM